MQSNIRLKTIELDAATTALGKAFQISVIRLERKYLCALTREQPLNNPVHIVNQINFINCSMFMACNQKLQKI